MSKWTVSVSWSIEVEAEDEGDAMHEAEQKFSFYGEANAEEEETD